MDHLYLRLKIAERPILGVELFSCSFLWVSTASLESCSGKQAVMFLASVWAVVGEFCTHNVGAALPY